MTDHIGIIGGGNMGEALIAGMLKAELFLKKDIFVSDINSDRLQLLQDVYGINTSIDNRIIFRQSEIIILAVKPQLIHDVLTEFAQFQQEKLEHRLLISIAAGVTLGKMEACLYAQGNEAFCKNIPLIRVMPNTPALVQSGISGMSPNQYADDNDIKKCKAILTAVGSVLEFKEKDLDAVTALSGSGPAYVFYLMEAMLEGGLKAGLDHKKAKILTLKTIEGAAKLILQRDETPQELRRKVTSPGGTTAAALEVLQSAKVKDSIITAILAATERSAELNNPT